MSFTPEKIIYSNRKTLCLQITKDGKLVVRSPRKLKIDYIQGFIQKKSEWIEKSINKLLTNKKPQLAFNLSTEKINEHKKQAKVILKQLLDTWSKFTGLGYTNFHLSNAKTKWGSCSHKNRISLNWRLILTSQDIIDYVIIHELAHTKEKNHAKSFWDLVAKFYPEYKLARKNLKQFNALMSF